jgi:hypothetical protein
MLRTVSDCLLSSVGAELVVTVGVDVLAFLFRWREKKSATPSEVPVTAQVALVGGVFLLRPPAGSGASQPVSEENRTRVGRPTSRRSQLRLVRRTILWFEPDVAEIRSVDEASSLSLAVRWSLELVRPGPTASSQSSIAAAPQWAPLLSSHADVRISLQRRGASSWAYQGE